MEVFAYVRKEEPAAAVKQVAEGDLPSLGVEHVRLHDLLPWQRPPLLGQFVA